MKEKGRRYIGLVVWCAAESANLHLRGDATPMVPVDKGPGPWASPVR